MAIDINIPSQVKTYANLAGFPVSGSLKTIYIAEDTNKTYRWTGSVYVEISATAASTWGAIGGTLSNQTDLQTALNAKQNSLGFTAVPTTRTISTTAPLSGGGDLSADRTLSIATANSTTTGALSSTDWNTFNGKQSALVSGTNIKTINGNTILGSGDLTISTGITIGTTAITSGTVGRVLFQGTGNVVQQSANLFWDNTNGWLGIGTSSPISKLHIVGDTNIIYQQASTTGFTGKLYYAFKSGGVSGEAMALFGDFVGGVASAFAFSNASGTTVMQIRNGGNVQIGTTTDAGYKLDVNGTARFQSDVTVANSLMKIYVTGGAIRFEQLAGAGIPINFMQNGTIYQYIDQATLNIAFRNDYSFVMTTGNTSTINASAKMQIDSTTKGFLPPRMTTTQKNAIASPAAGLMVYDTTLNVISYYNGTIWI